MIDHPSPCAARLARSLAAILVALVLGPGLHVRAAHGHDTIPHSSQVFDFVGFDQRLDAEVPRDVTFRDEANRTVTLDSYLGGGAGAKPVVLALSYFECETLCPMVREGLLQSLSQLAFSVGAEFDVVFVSINPEETPAEAAAVKAETVATYARPGSEAGWHFLTGNHESIDALAEAIGFRYAYDPQRDEYAHPSGLVILTPSGKVARYFYGIDYSPRDLRLGLVDASHGRVGSPIDQLLLLCYRYDPAVGKYNVLILNIVRAGGLLTVTGVAALILVLRRQESNRTPRPMDSRS